MKRQVHNINPVYSAGREGGCGIWRSRFPEENSMHRQSM